DLLEALEIAHQNRVIHRDVKPANVFFDGERGVLTDFGIARRLTEEQKSDLRILQGTAAYMAPEQFAGVADARTDLYSAGMVIYEAFTGRRWAKTAPKAGDWAGVPFFVARVLRRALELDPTNRWPDVASFRRRLWHTRVWPYQRNAIGIAIGCTLLGLGIRASMPAPSTLRFHVAAATLDSTCWLCYWRHAEVGRWFDLEDDPTDSPRYLAHLKEFPDYYQKLIRAEQLPLAARLDSLDALTKRSKDFLFGQFRYAD